MNEFVFSNARVVAFVFLCDCISAIVIVFV